MWQFSFIWDILDLQLQFCVQFQGSKFQRCEPTEGGLKESNYNAQISKNTLCKKRLSELGLLSLKRR